MTDRDQTILVTGAAGFAGSHLLDALASERCRIVGLRRPGIGAEVEPRYPAVEWIEVELLDRDAVIRTIAKYAPDVIYHLAGAPHTAQSWAASADALSVNAIASCDLFDAVDRAGLRPRMVVPSTAHVYASSSCACDEDSPLGPTSPYAISKIAAEVASRLAFQRQGIGVVVARSFNHIGPRQAPQFLASSVAKQVALIEAGQQEPVIGVGNVDTRRDFTDVRDTVRAYIALARSGQAGRIYNVCTGKARLVRELLEGLVSLAKVPVTIERDPARFRPNDTALLLGDPSRIMREVGWAPAIPFEQTLRDLLEYWRHAV